MTLTFGSMRILRALDETILDESNVYAKDFVVHYHVQPPKKPLLHVYENTEYVILLLGTVYETTTGNPAEHIFRLFQRLGPESVHNIDGCFLFLAYNKQVGTYTVFSERFGVIPLYYSLREGNILFSTSQPLLFSDFSQEDMDLTAVRDLMRHGTLIGEATLSRKVKILEGGNCLTFEKGTARKKRTFLFHYDEDNAERNIDKLIDNVAETYLEAVRKRVEPLAEDACIFLSGGIDSRFLLATFNRLFPDRVACITMGQPFSEEEFIAGCTASLKGNSHLVYTLYPHDFLQNSKEFIRLTCGSDVFFQSFSLTIGDRLPFSSFATGFSLDALIGGTFLNEDGVNAVTPLSSFFHVNERAFKMQLFSEEEFNLLCEDHQDPLPQESEYLKTALSEYDSLHLCDAMQPFGVRSRAMRLVLGRELVFCKFMDEIYPSVDRDFLAAITMIPAKERLNHSFYRKLLLRVHPEYCVIPYNNTNLPISAPLKEWKRGTLREVEREKIYASMQIDSLKNNSLQSPYYPHFYSDFTGCTRMDRRWRKLMSDTLLSGQPIITKKWFNQARIQQLFHEHLNGVRDHRGKLTYLTSLEMFLQQSENKDISF